MLGPLRKEWLARSLDQTDSRYVVIRTDCEERPPRSKIEVREATAPGKHDFVTEADIESQPVVNLPVVLNVRIGYSRKGILGCAPEIAEATEAAGGGLRIPQQVIGKGISSESPAETERSVLVISQVVAGHQAVDIRADSEVVVALDPGESFAEPVINVVLHCTRSVAHEPGRIAI